MRTTNARGYSFLCKKEKRERERERKENDDDYYFIHWIVISLDRTQQISSRSYPIMTKVLVFLACAMFIFAFVHHAHAEDESDDHEYGRKDFCSIEFTFI